MMLRHKVLLAAIVCTGLAACSSLNRESSSLGSPDLIGQLGSADLSARGQQQTPSRTEFASGDRSGGRASEYPGSDQVVGARADFNGLAKSGNGYELNFNDAGL